MMLRVVYLLTYPQVESSTCKVWFHLPCSHHYQSWPKTFVFQLTGMGILELLWPLSEIRHLDFFFNSCLLPASGLPNFPHKVHVRKDFYLWLSSALTCTIWIESSSWCSPLRCVQGMGGISYVKDLLRRFKGGVWEADKLSGNGHGDVMPDFCQQCPFINKNEMHLSKFSCPAGRKLSVAASKDGWQPLQMFYSELKAKAGLSFTVSCFPLSPISSKYLFSSLFRNTWVFSFYLNLTPPQAPWGQAPFVMFCCKCYVGLPCLFFSLVIFFPVHCWDGMGRMHTKCWEQAVARTVGSRGFTLWSLNNPVKECFSCVCTASANLCWV